MTSDRIDVMRPSFYPESLTQMALGRFVRRHLGPLETPAGNFYRSCFFDLDTLISSIRATCEAKTILEVGCGEGLVLERLAAVYPDARLLGIDITPQIGRLFRGDSSRVEFLQAPIEDIARDRSGAFDVVLLSDVVHHVPWTEHKTFLGHVLRTVSERGWLVIKEWERRGNFIHPICHFADRCITGDRTRYHTKESLQQLIEPIVGHEKIQRFERFPPWPNNMAFFIRPNAESTCKT